jgi:hypothetical protein
VVYQLHVIVNSTGWRNKLYQTFVKIEKTRFSVYLNTFLIQAQRVVSWWGIRNVKLAQNKNLEKAVYKWFVQQRSSGVIIYSVDLRAASETLAKHEYSIPGEWWAALHFRKRHGITNRKASDDSLSADTDQVEPFRQYIKDLIKSESHTLSQVYNVDETGLFFELFLKITWRTDMTAVCRPVNWTRIAFQPYSVLILMVRIA